MVRTIISGVAVHAEPLEGVNVRFTDPAFISARLGVYVGLRMVALLKVPVPEVVHTTETEFVADPESKYGFEPQVEAFAPALAVVLIATLTVWFTGTLVHPPKETISVYVPALTAVAFGIVIF